VPFDILTDSVGKASFSWKIPHFAAPGIYTIIANVDAKGYVPAMAETAAKLCNSIIQYTYWPRIKQNEPRDIVRDIPGAIFNSKKSLVQWRVVHRNRN
jgi:hypothetical protein